jgi:hypothetical protein
MHRMLRRSAVAVFGLALVAGAAGPAFALSDHGRATRGSAYLVSQQQPDGSINGFSPIGSTSDAVLAFVASKVGGAAMNRAIGFLQAQTSIGKVVGIGLTAKVVMALDAAGRNPRRFGGHNLLKEIESTRGRDGHYGTSSVFDDALAVLAVVSAGDTPPAAASTWLLDGQCPDGGWAYDAPYDPQHDDAHCHSGDGDFFNSDSNTTSYVVQGLEATAHPDWTADPFAFFDTLRDPEHGGWSYDASFVTTDANSTSLVIQAYVAASRSLPKGGLAALRDLQHAKCGAWAYSWNGDQIGDPDVGATIAAIPAVLQISLPIPPGHPKKGVPGVPSC